MDPFAFSNHPDSNREDIIRNEKHPKNITVNSDLKARFPICSSLEGRVGMWKLYL